MDEEHFCWQQCCDLGPHACICGTDCSPETPSVVGRCECGRADGPFTLDVAGCPLCPECTAVSAVHCDICGDNAPVRLYDQAGGSVGEVLTIGHPVYIAVCRACDGGARVGHHPLAPHDGRG